MAEKIVPDRLDTSVMWERRHNPDSNTIENYRGVQSMYLEVSSPVSNPNSAIKQAFDAAAIAEGLASTEFDGDDVEVKGSLARMLGDTQFEAHAFFGRKDDVYFSFPQSSPLVEGRRRMHASRRFVDTSGLIILTGTPARDPEGRLITTYVPVVCVHITIRERNAVYNDLLLDNTNAGKWNAGSFYGFPAGTVQFHGSYPLLRATTTASDSSRKEIYHEYEYRAAADWKEYDVKADGTILAIDPTAVSGAKVTLTEPIPLP